MRWLKDTIKSGLQRVGYDITPYHTKPAFYLRPVGEMRFLLEDLRARGFRPQSILDVGGNIGEWSKLARAVFPEGELFIVEPQAEMKPYLDGVCAQFPRTKWLNAGAGPRAGEMTLTIDDVDSGGSSMLPAASTELKSKGRQRTVPIVTLDSLVESGQMKVPDLAKFDIQGFELEALRGAQLLLGKTEVFILETSLYRFMPSQPLMHEVIAFMLERGYVIYDLPGFGRRPSDGALGQVDVCFVKSDSRLRASNAW